MSADRRLHILFLDQAEIIGGGQLALADHIRHLDKTRFAPEVACSDTMPELAERFAQAGAVVNVLPFPRLRGLTHRTLPPLAAAGRQLRALVRGGRFDLVVANTSRSAYIAALALPGNAPPVIWWVRDFDFGRGWFRLFHRRASALVGVSVAIRDFYAGRRAANWSVQCVGSDMHSGLAACTPPRVTAERARWGLGPEHVVIGYMGRLVEGKGPEDLVEAIEILCPLHPNLRGLIVGTGDGQTGDVGPRLRASVAARGLSDIVRFAGHQSDQALYYSAFDLFVLSSRYREAMPLSVVQAMMAGRPVVATTTGGTPEVVTDGLTGLLVPPCAPKAMAAGIHRLLTEPELARRLQSAAHEHVMRTHREEMLVTKMESLYETVAQAPRRGHEIGV